MTSQFDKLTVIFNTVVSSSKDSEKLMEKWNAQKAKIKNILQQVEKLKKNKEGPKKAKSSYICFCDEERAQVKLDNPDMKATEITSELGARWNRLKEDPERADELERYREMSESDKSRYETEKADFVPTENSKKRGKKQPKEGPKNSKSAYLFFCDHKRKEIREANPEFKATDVTRQLGAMWNELKAQGEEALTEYAELAAQDKIRFENEKEAFLLSKGKTVKAKKAPAKNEETNVQPKGKPRVETKSVQKAESKVVPKAAPRKHVSPSLSDVESEPDLTDEESENESESEEEQTPFQKFSFANRDRLKKENPKMSPTEITNLLKTEFTKKSRKGK